MSMSPHMSPHVSHKGRRRQQHPARLRKHLKIDQTSANLPKMRSRIESMVNRTKRAAKTKTRSAHIQAEPRRPTVTLLGSARVHNIYLVSMLENHMMKNLSNTSPYPCFKTKRLVR